MDRDSEKIVYEAMLQTWQGHVGKTLLKLRKKHLPADATNTDVYSYWMNIGSHKRKSKQAEIINALMFTVHSNLYCYGLSDMREQMEAAFQEEMRVATLNFNQQVDFLESENALLAKMEKELKASMCLLIQHMNSQRNMVSEVKAKGHISSVAVCDSQSPSCTEISLFDESAVPKRATRLMCMENSQFDESAESKHAIRKQDKYCTFCLKLGHRIRKCWSLDRGRPPPYVIRRRTRSEGAASTQSVGGNIT